MLQRLKAYEVEVFNYDSRDERESHIVEMELLGWECSGKIQVLDKNIHAKNVADENYEWRAYYRRNTV